MIKRMGQATVFLLALGPLVFVCSVSLAANRWAVIVGIDSYQSPEISRLKGAANDAKSLADTLKKNLGFPDKNVLVYTSDKSGAKAPTTGNISSNGGGSG